MTPLWIDTATQLQAACARWSARPWITVDTEFVRIDTYRARLCLVQVGDGHENACIDTLAIDDLQPLWALLHNPAVLKVLHACSQDFEIVVEHTGATPAPVFDTQIAATLLGFGDQIGYAGLVERCLGVVIDKRLSRTDWARRPLTGPEIAYAADDVRHLATLYPTLQQQVADAGRLDWLAEDCQRLTDANRYSVRPDDAWQRLKGLGRLDAASQSRAVALAAWRETQAQARNRPRKWIIEDAAIYQLAERAPDSAAALAQLSSLPPKTLERHGSALLAVLQEAPAARQWMRDELAGDDKALFKRLQALVREAGERLQLPPGYLAPRQDLEALVRTGPAARAGVLQGWRRPAVGEALLAALPPTSD
ncbi:ribonuclease D [Flagellatimonas centrodinii]|uniref:ribonuclease D n=1 Tax=Flagellatimonas centrodinii TaxID=2806210 RepID=UPI001FF00CA1|nr:ribonuclease D [Flagellatimonas centrodinii]ULQ47084.1 ribonuclease D [Flagellatimonas centrodinii]